MRMGINLRRLTMCSPSGMPYTASTTYSVSVICFLRKSLKSSLSLNYLIFSLSIANSHTR